MTEWETYIKAWSNPPVDDVGYLSAATMLGWTDTKLRQTVATMRTTRYSLQGCRNWENRWRDLMGLDSTHGQDVLDYGCGVGLEALELAQAGNRVSLADISTTNLHLAGRVLYIHSQTIHGSYLVSNRYPYIAGSVDRELTERFDVFHCNGVLHHSREPVETMARAHQILRPGGVVRLMVYSDHGWRIATGTEPPDQPETHPWFGRFVRYFDSVGDYADWYNRDRLEQRFGDLFTVERCEYLTPDMRYLGAVLRRKDTPDAVV